VIAFFQVEFTSLDSYQLLYLQDSIEFQGAIGKKIVLLNASSTFTSNDGKIARKVSLRH